MRKITIGVIILLVAFLLASPVATYAQGSKPEDKLIFGGSYTLPGGSTLPGNLVVMGGTATVEKNATVGEDVAVIGGSAFIDGFVMGDLVALGGIITLGPNAVIQGDATAIGGAIERDPNARVQGNIVETDEEREGEFIGRIGRDGFQLTPVPGVPPVPPVPDAPSFEGNFQNFPVQTESSGPLGWLYKSFLAGISAIVWTAILAALGVILVLVAPRPTERVANAIAHSPLLAFGVGLAAMILLTPAIALLMLILTLTICLIPLAIAIPFILFGILLFGWLALGWLLGRELLKAINSENATPVWEAIVGVAVLTLLWRMPQILPWVGGFFSWLIFMVVASMAVGGVLLTRLGRQDYPQPEAAPAAEHILPPASSVAPAADSTDSPTITPPPEE